MSIYRRRRIAIRPYTCVIRTLANIHINHVNTQKKTSWAWYEGVCVCRRGELQFAHIANLSHIAKFIHISNSPMWMGELQFAHTTICPYCISNILRIHLCGRANCNSPTPQFAHIAKFAHIVFRPHFKFTHVEGRITIRPYTCIFWMLANIHVIKYKYTCKYLNTCKLMIERIYIPT